MPATGLPRAVRGGEGCVDMARFGRSKLEFLLKFIKLENCVPSRDAFSDLFNALDPGASATLFRSWRPAGASF